MTYVRTYLSLRTSRVNDKISLASKRKSNEFIGRISKRLLGQTGRVAFHVYLTSNRCYNDHEVIDYDGEELDIGNGYNEKDGIYVVPVSGVYVFTWTFLADYAQYAVTEIVVNGEKKGWTITDGTSQSLLLSPSSSLIVTSVNAGDHVFIRRVQGRGCSAVNSQYMRATFSGWQLSP
ncbi:complement C1q-like protein 4 [Mercenaria mercenaria]|uniref:complement C1q-like protein 4 n=1 Tax=Mercenaria mercenaria TaxID=6596 RepID=UPI00234E80EF|nr:complement C1q-like protein 4 [Mercenaria mercenaria]